MRKLIAILLIFVVAFAPAAAFAGISEVPYQSYTFDKWGNAVASPNGYMPQRSIRGSALGIGDFLNPSDLFVQKERKEIYIADSGNNRIVVIDQDYSLIKVMDTFGEEPLNNPTGIFVTSDGTIYIADQGNARVLVCTQDGNIIASYAKPESDLITEQFDYKPNKVVVDSFGKIYIQAIGVFQGMLCLNPDGSFINYYGSNRVEMTAKLIFQQFLKNFMTLEQASKMQNAVPIEYSNIFIDEKDFIFATAAATENNSNLITKLNSLGVNIFIKTNPIWYRNSVFADIVVDEQEIITVVDTTKCKLYQCDKTGRLMFAFGGMGNQLGLYKKPCAIEELNGTLMVLDSEKNDITLLEPTSFGNKVQTAINLYNQGKYQENIEPWQEVIRQSSNYLLAYTGIGKAYFQIEEYELAMEYFTLANDKAGYSDAFREYSLIVMRANFGFLAAAVLLIVIGAITISQHFKRKRARERRMRYDGGAA